jgi:hypothetical protein
VFFNDLLNLCLYLWCDVTSCNLFEQRGFSRRQVLAEFSFPLRDLINRDGIQLQYTTRQRLGLQNTGTVRTRPFTPA